jgi:diguanylate cyclase (GGDEF)-like protein
MPHPQYFLKPSAYYLILLVLIVLSSSDFFIEDYFLQQAIHHQRGEIQSQLSLLRTRIESVINSNIQLVQGLASVISANPNIDQEYFARIGKEIIHNSKIIRNIAGAPDLVISLMYPLQGNQAAMGLNYNTNPQQKDAALKAIETGRLILAGPLQLRQGGTGFVARTPVYSNSFTTNGSSRLWGLLASVIDADKFYQQAGLTELSMKLKVAIRGRDASGASGDPFYGDTDIYQVSPVTETINLPYGSWQLAAVPVDGWLTQSPNRWLIREISFLVALLLIMLIVLNSFNQIKQQALKQDLKKSNYRFTSVLDSMNAVVFVTDLQSDALLYANPKAEATFASQSSDSRYTQKIQYHLQQSSAICSRTELLDENGDPGPPRSGDFYDKRVDSWFHCEIHAIPWDDGRMARLEVATDISQIKKNEQLLNEAHKSLEMAANFDQLTGLPNRRMLNASFEEIVNSLEIDAQKLIICYLDLDGFKQVNDNLGHEVGDHLLRMVAQRLDSSLGDKYMVSRWGGDEFALLITVDDLSQASEILEHILSRVTEIYTYQDYQLEISASIGVAVYSDADSDVDTLLRQADQAMYAAKQQGKQQFCFFDADKDRKIFALQGKVNEISRAISENEMVLHYQPKLSLSEQRVYGVEVLIRWSHAQRGLLPPVEFLPFVHGTETQIQLDWWVIQNAISQALQWQRHHVDLNVSINVSPQTLQQDDFIERLIKFLNHQRLKPGRVELEILESDVADIEKITQVIQELDNFNISFALDDYGTGYSSLTYLRKLPVHTLKIDQSFVRDMLTDQEDLNIVQGVIGLARVFNRDVIAEGVETIEHGIKLASLNCNNLQGYGIARPMSLEQFNDWLAKYQIPQQWLI